MAEYQDLDNMSDDEILAMGTPPEQDVPHDKVEEKAAFSLSEPPEEEETPVEKEPEQEEIEEEVTEVVDKADESDNKESDSEVLEDNNEADVFSKSDDELEDFGKETPKSKKDEPVEAKAEDEAEAKSEGEGDDVKEDTIDYKAAYEKIMGPFKANGKEIQLESPEEALKLMQMGANYTKKLQALQPNLKLVKMLENNGLLDEGKLSYLIDLDKKDPAAIQKLVRESGIDPIDIDTSVEPSYVPGNHSPSDQELQFQNTLEEVASNPSGQKLIIAINSEWDTASKDELFADPNLLNVLSQQKETGIYDTITAEVERQRMLGNLNGLSSIRAYYAVGQELHSKGKLAPQTPQAPPQIQSDPERQRNPVIETRTASRKVDKSNADKVRAAAPTRSAPNTQPKQDFNPLNMSDEEFEKTMSIKV